ncbi:DNA-dependent RNA polymerase subunit epsilon [Vagococcus fluvialis]|uniref:DNA-dependent RNA polymerase subunit epsilon n=1 Tax=Vagococcus fluvialis TaxID=2738 RepID=UPI001A8F1E82|nr:DNA-dependent RNA polymerase subunit epsilon [Vagococcus fluvialis]MBO0442791.1 DNA-dependent RNA polymerase auxiliary subunit epsilon family protein [Vagococcus fluvialis]MBO0479463.1 DNA-dependent RNA polymerase auxiliary subunit epsilon family protein [Vagococcus fluvialis]MBO0484899.1 DNA-dependent RNA polymerase auxiliary subunit epsilon family protein [Vagococcus fluvialis]MCM2138060.1 DNA-directed RNA polymerase subunit epsilon [Vagococcus fluvialis]UDM73926.1 DNA-dependent RNA polym
MIYKVYYQEDKARSPQREKTISLYMEASSSVEARKIIEDNTPYNIELIQELDGNHLDYEKENADFKLVEFE